MMNVLDAQLAILNIEGIRSEHQIYQYEETETVPVICDKCAGEGTIEPDDWNELEFDFYLDEYVPVDYKDCDACEGNGYSEKSKTFKYTESWTESNIIL